MVVAFLCVTGVRGVPISQPQRVGGPQDPDGLRTDQLNAIFGAARADTGNSTPETPVWDWETRS